MSDTCQLLADLVPEGGWLKQNQPRIKPLDDAELSFTQKTALRGMLKVGKAKCPNLFKTMFRNFRVYFPFARFNATVMPRGKLLRRHTELAILRVAWHTRSYYEWGQHVEIGLRIGLSLDDIVRVTQGCDASGWDELESLILRAVDELVEHKVLSEPTWQALSSRLSNSKMIELLFLISSYTALACVLNSVGVQLEPEVEAVLSGQMPRSAQ